MDELDNLDIYNGDSEHDMWVDFTYQENTNELSDIFSASRVLRDYDEVIVDDFINNLNDWD